MRGGDSSEHTLKGAKILDLCTTGAELFSRLVCSFWRLATGPLEAPWAALEPGIVIQSRRQAAAAEMGGRVVRGTVEGSRASVTTKIKILAEPPRLG